MVNSNHTSGAIVVGTKELHQLQCQGLNSPQECPRREKAVRVDTILTKCSVLIRMRYNMLEKGNSTSNPTLLNIELMDSTTCLDV